MISVMSARIAKRLYVKNEKNKVEVDVIQYGLELFFSTVINLGIVIGLSLILNCFVETILFFAFFSSLRFIAGGFHASSHLKCLLFYSGFCFGTIYLMRLVEPSNTNFWIIGMSIASTILIFWRAPSATQQKPLSSVEYRKFKKISRQLILVESFFIIVSCILIPKIDAYLLIVAGAIFVEALTLIPILKGDLSNEKVY